MLQDRNEGKSQQGANVKWEGVHVKTKNKLTVRIKKDRAPSRILMTLEEQGRQILQVACKHWGDEDSEEAQRGAFAFIITTITISIPIVVATNIIIMIFTTTMTITIDVIINIIHHQPPSKFQ